MILSNWFKDVCFIYNMDKLKIKDSDITAGENT